MNSPLPWFIFILVFVGGKMILSHFYPVPVAIALGVIVAILAASVAASLIWPKKDHAGHAHTH